MILSLMLLVSQYATMQPSRADCFKDAKNCDLWTPSSIKKFQSTLELRNVQPLKGPPETHAILGKRVIIPASYKPVLKGNSDPAALVFAPSGIPAVYAGRPYIEATNSTCFTTLEGKRRRDFTVTRLVRPYESKVYPQGNVEPTRYVSDLGLFERKGNGEYVFRKILLFSNPEKNFFIEDPRVSTLLVDGKKEYLLGVSVIDRGLSNKTLVLKVDSGGEPLAFDSTPDELRKLFGSLSPSPVMRADGSIRVVDAKNGIVARNEDGKIVVFTRYRPDFGDPEIHKLAGDTKWGYADQVFVFEPGDFEKYDWSHALEDLFGKGGGEKRVRPLQAKVLFTDKDLKERLTDPRILKEKGIGFGPGTPLTRLRREGNKLYAAEYAGAPEIQQAIPPSALHSFYLKEGEIQYFSFHHQARYFDQSGFVKRNYSAPAVFFDRTMTEVRAYYADAIQPLSASERSGGGVLDLHGILYLMGRRIDLEGDRMVLSAVGGGNDTRTVEVTVSIMQLLLEMAPGSERWNSGQIYIPGI